MCGIWASVGWQVSSQVVDAVASRGPDSNGWSELPSFAGPVSLGHVRLAVFDQSSAGKQPFKSKTRKHTIVFNGAIFNFRGLRETLERSGHKFHSETDTEVILAAYAEWGAGCLEKFNGMFAFVIYDEDTGKLFAARDRFGIKPLYLYADESGIGFASEVRQLLASGKVSGIANERLCRDFLVSSVLDHDGETFIRDIVQLRGGECITVHLTQQGRFRQCRPDRWYEKPVPGSLDISRNEAIEEFSRLMVDATSIRLPADAQVGFALSGGLDSSLVTALARRTFGSQFVTFSARYNDPVVDEKEYIEEMEKYLEAKAVHVFPEPGDFASSLEDICRNMDAPFASTSIFAQWSVFRAARNRGIKVMLTGQGADEMLCGYLPMLNVLLSDHLRKADFCTFAHDLQGHIGLHGAPIAETVMRAVAGALPASMISSVRRFRKVDWLSEEFRNAGHHTSIERSDIGKHIASLVFDLSLPGLLHYQDRTSMMNGIESREPFLDHRVVELLISLGGKYKVRNGETKSILREAFQDLLPQKIIQRHSKIGFETPEQTWLAGDLRSIVKREFDSVGERFPGYFNRAAVERMSARFDNGDLHPNMPLWRIVSFSIWARQSGVG